jgi:L-asparaginase
VKVYIFIAGGTIDKVVEFHLYFDSKTAYEVGEPQIDKFLKQTNVTTEYEIQPLLRKDSLDMTMADRELIAKAVMDSPGKHFLITHGTDTMIETGRVLKRIPDKVIVLTGAMQPARTRDSDAVFNVGFAFGAAQYLRPGAYIAMNGRIFDPDHARKNVGELRFEEVR